MGCLLATVVAQLPGGGEDRPGQSEMADAISKAIVERRHLIVQAGTGTGKSLAYLVPAIESGARVVVATATKALQDQLANKDLPFLAEHLDEPFAWAVLKGRSNYVCRQRLAESKDGGEQLEIAIEPSSATGQEVVRLREWAKHTVTGDRAELDFEPSARAWDSVSVTPRECPGAQRCPQGEVCFAEDARAAAAAATVIVVNTHLYAINVVTDGGVLPEHEVAIIDEAHQLEDVVSAAAGIELTAGRWFTLARAARAVLEDNDIVDTLNESARRIQDLLAQAVGKPIMSLPGDLGDALVLGRSRLLQVSELVRKLENSPPAASRVLTAASALMGDIDIALTMPATHVAWVETSGNTPVFRLAPIDVGDVLTLGLWSKRTAVLTSATVPTNLPGRIGLERDAFDALDVGSPFDYETHTLLYCALGLPDPRDNEWTDAAISELVSLIEAAGGRTLALFTSWRVLESFSEALLERLDYPLLTQRDLPKPALMREFQRNETSVLLATMGFWQGVDIPGAALSLLAIDRIPFPRPDDPLLQARRERADGDAFRAIDLPRAAVMLAQGAGRLIRTKNDRGVVAVLDKRLGSAPYRWDLVNALPPMPRTRDLDEAVRFLEALRS